MKGGVTYELEGHRGRGWEDGRGQLRGGGGALLAHCVGDGGALLHLLLSRLAPTQKEMKQKPDCIFHLSFLKPHLSPTTGNVLFFHLFTF